MKSRQKMNTDDSTKNVDEKKVAEKMMPSNVKKRQKTEMSSDNIQATLLSGNASQDSVLSSDFNQQKTPENRVEPSVLSFKDSDMECNDVNLTDDTHIQKMRARPKILADIG